MDRPARIKLDTPVHSNLRSHPKLSALRRELDLDKLRIPIKWQRHITRVFLIDFWHWTLDNYPDGDITGVESDLIAEGCNYPSDPDAFVEALVTAGFIDRMQDGRLLVHDWEEYGGRLEKRRDAGRVRKERERNKEDVTPHVTPHVTRDIHHQVTPEVTPHVTPPQERTGQNKKDRSPLTPPVVQSKTRNSDQEVTEVTSENTAQCADDERCTQPVPVGDTICKPHKIMQQYKETKEQSEIENEPQSTVNPDNGA